MHLACRPTHNNHEQIGNISQSILTDSVWAAHNFNENDIYKPLMLFESGHSIFTIGQSLKKVDTSLSYRIDPNGDFQHHFPMFKDYLTTDDDISIHKVGEHSYINGMVYFSADENEQRIFNVSGHWTFAAYDETVLSEMQLWLITHIFPTLKDVFEFRDGWKYEQDNQNQVERLSLSKEDSTFWNLEYKVILK